MRELRKNFWHYLVKTCLAFSLIFLPLFAISSWIAGSFLFRVINMVLWGIYLLLIPVFLYVILYIVLFSRIVICNKMWIAQMLGLLLFLIFYAGVIVFDTYSNGENLERISHLTSSGSFEIPISYLLAFAYFNYIFWKNEERRE